MNTTKSIFENAKKEEAKSETAAQGKGDSVKTLDLLLEAIVNSLLAHPSTIGRQEIANRWHDYKRQP